LHGALKGRTPKSSAEKHLKKKVLIKEDIENFFDSITANNVEKMWLRLFQFHPDVSRALTKLTTFEGRVPQGAPTSSYIANLILWDKEPILVKNLKLEGFTYTRFVDDVTLSTNRTDSDFSSQISDLYGVFFSKGLKPKRKKHEIQRSGSRQEVQGIITNNRKAALSCETRKAIRSEIRLLKLLYSKDQFAKEFRKKYLSCVGKLNWLQQHHPKLAATYWIELKNIQPSLSSYEKNQLNSEVMKLEAIARRQGCVSKRAKKGVSDLLDGLSTVDKDWVRPYRSRIKNMKLADQ
ncbi:MAG: reverse transcriptase family protein, partial [Taibaiella sp.]|nr:reverse transcriptase family protein [Taibaiella sp.]